MGKLSHEVQIQHFSHPHPLELINPQTLNLSPCSACKLQHSGWMYTCKPCNFTLHTSCSQLPHLITHPSHPGHPLSLLPVPAYSVGYFSCDGCGQRGHGFNYHCNQCEFDIHSVCASKPLAIRCHSHPCQLQLFFYPPYQTKGFSCDICHQIGSNHWLYRCSICEFDVHMSCVNSTAPSASTYTRTYTTSTPRQGNVQIQTWNSFPGPAQSNLQNRNAAAQMNNQCYNNVQNNGPPPAQGNGGLMDVAVQGFVDGAAQQVGQNFVQTLMGGGGDPNNGGDNGGGDNGGGDNGGGNNSSMSMVDIGSSLLSGMFGSSES